MQNMVGVVPNAVATDQHKSVQCCQYLEQRWQKCVEAYCGVLLQTSVPMIS